MLFPDFVVGFLCTLRIAMPAVSRTPIFPIAALYLSLMAAFRAVNSLTAAFSVVDFTAARLSVLFFLISTFCARSNRAMSRPHLVRVVHSRLHTGALVAEGVTGISQLSNIWQVQLAGVMLFCRIGTCWFVAPAYQSSLRRVTCCPALWCGPTIWVDAPYDAAPFLQENT